MPSGRRASSQQHERQVDLPTRSRPSATNLTNPTPVPPQSLQNHFFMPTPFINAPRNPFEAVFDGHASTSWASPPFMGPGYLAPTDMFGRPLPFIPPHSPQAYPPMPSMPPFGFPTSNRIFETSDDELTNTSRRPIPIIDNPPPGTLNAEEQRKKTEIRKWLDEAPSDVKRDQKEFQAFSQHIVAKALTHTPHENFFYSSIDNDFSQPQLLRCIYYLSSKIYDKDKKSSNGYEFAMKKVRESSGRHTSSRRIETTRSSESASRQHYSGRHRDARGVRFNDDDDQSEQDIRNRSSIASRHTTESHRSNRNVNAPSSTRTTGRPATTNHGRSAAASAAANAAINRRAAATPPPDTTAEELTFLSQRLMEAETELACHASAQVELHELKQKAEARKCKICYTAEIDCIFVDCYHMATCLECAQGCEKCPVCRKEGVSVAKVYL